MKSFSSLSAAILEGYNFVAMGITLLTGPINAGKTTHLLTTFRQAIQAEEEAFFLLPNEPQATEVRSLYLQEGALLGDRFLSLASFLRVIAKPSWPVMNRAQQTLLTFNSLRSQSLRYFSSQRMTMGIAAEAAETITLLKQNLVTPMKLRDMLETRGSLKEFDLLQLFERYEEELKTRELYDRGDLMHLAIEQLSELQASLIIFDEFFVPPPGIFTLLQRLREEKPSLAVIVSHPTALSEKELFAETATEAIAQLSSLADEIQELPPRKTDTPTVSFLSLRSPLEEIRFLSHLVTRNREELPLETVIASRAISSLPDELSKNCGGILSDTTLLTNTILSTLRKGRSQQKLGEYLEAALSILEQEASENRARFDLKTALLEMKQTPFIPLAEQISLETFEEIVKQIPSSFRNEHHLPYQTASFEEGIATPVDRIIIPEIVEGNIPRATSERLFFTDRTELAPTPNQLLDVIFPTSDHLLAQEAFRFATLLCKATQEVVLTFSILDDEGSEQMASSFLEEFGPPVPMEAPLPIPRATQQKEFRQELQWKKMIEEERMQGRPEHPEYHGIITDPKALEMLRERFTHEALSPSRLEAYAECPHRFFFERVLRLKPGEELDHDILPHDRGTVIHAVLEELYQKHLNLFRAAIRDPAQEEALLLQLQAILEGVFEKHPELMSRSSPLLRPHQRREMTILLEETVLAEVAASRKLPEAPLPHTCEWRFGENAETALRLSIPGEPDALIRGQVDRIDVTEQGIKFLITDYKTGRTIKSVRKKTEEGKHFQLPLYIEAVGQMLLPEAIPLGGILYAVNITEKQHGLLRKEGNEISYTLSNRSRTLVKEEEWEELLQRSKTHAVAIVSKIRKGMFAREELKACEHCHFQEACRKV